MSTHGYQSAREQGFRQDSSFKTPSSHTPRPSFFLKTSIMAFALHDAARSGDIATLTSLIGQGANLDQKDRINRTPLHLAAWAGHADCVKALIAAGCKVGAGAQVRCWYRQPFHRHLYAGPEHMKKTVRKAAA